MKKILVICSFLVGILFLADCDKAQQPTQSATNEGKIVCNSYSIETCPDKCVVCPPCEACSSISCQTEEFCKNIGFNRNWYESIKTELNG